MIHYIVIRHPFAFDHPPTVEHENFSDAIAEAERLANKHPHHRFRVYQYQAESWASVEVKSTRLFPPNVRDHRAGRCYVAKQKRSLWPAPVHRLVGRIFI